MQKESERSIELLRRGGGELESAHANGTFLDNEPRRTPIDPVQKDLERVGLSTISGKGSQTSGDL